MAYVKNNTTTPKAHHHVMDPEYVNRYDDEGQTPLIRACARGHCNTMNTLIAAGADVNLGDRENGCTPLREAAANGQIEAMKLLIAAKADLNLAERDRFTPLHAAVMNGRLEAVEVLLLAGADLSLRDRKDSLTPRELAVKKKYNDVVSLIDLHQKQREASASSNAKYTQFGEFLKANNFHEYVSKFSDERIDFDTARTLTDADLQTMGLPLGIRKKLLSLLQENQQQEVRIRARELKSDKKEKKQKKERKHASSSSLTSSKTGNVLTSVMPSVEDQNAAPPTHPSIQPHLPISLPSSAKTHVLPFDSLTFEKKLGEGAFGVVHLVLEKRTGLYFAAKILKCSFNGLDRDAKEEFEKEAALLFSLRNPFIVSFTGFSLDRSQNLILLSEYMAGGSLNYWLYRKKHIFASQIKLRLAADIASGISYLHGRSILHRDLKSDNIFLDDDGAHAKVGDLGLAKTRSSEASLAVSTVGTMIYMAPEMLRGEPYSTAVDVYAFALVVYELYSGQRPFPISWDFYTMKQKVNQESHRPDLKAVASMPTHISALIQKCWANEPSARLSMKQVVEQLRV